VNTSASHGQGLYQISVYLLGTALIPKENKKE